MGLKRQLQSEIDRCLKRVAEAQADFQELWLKLEQMETAPKPVKLDVPAPQYSHACNKDAAAREKMLAELKKHLKKMQKQREQIRAWLMSPETKDAQGLSEARRSIEVDMERFKVCEKQNKTKAYSKVGLLREDKVDPAEIAREETTDWLNSVVAKLEAQVEENEAEIEEIAAGEGGRGKKQSNLSPRAEDLSMFIARHKSHIVRLEQVLRLVKNEQITPSDVEDSLRDGLEYYLESSTEPDFYQQEEDDDNLYASIPLLSEVDENIGKIVTPAADRNRSPAAPDPPEQGEERSLSSTPQAASPPSSEAKTARQTKVTKRAARAATADVSAPRKSRTSPSSPKTPPGQAPANAASHVTPSTSGEPETPPKAMAWNLSSIVASPAIQSAHTLPSPPVATKEQGGSHATMSTPKSPKTANGDAQLSIPRSSRKVLAPLASQNQQQQQHQHRAPTHSTEAATPKQATRETAPAQTVVPLLTPTHESQGPRRLDYEGQVAGQVAEQSSEQSTPASARPEVTTVCSPVSSLPAQWPSVVSDAARSQGPPRILMRPAPCTEPADPRESSARSSPTASQQTPHHVVKATQDWADANHVDTGNHVGPQRFVSAKQPQPAPCHDIQDGHAGCSPTSSRMETSTAAPAVAGQTSVPQDAASHPLPNNHGAEARGAPMSSTPRSTNPSPCTSHVQSNLLTLLDASMRFGPTNCDADWRHLEQHYSQQPLHRPKVLQRPTSHHATRNTILLPNSHLPELQSPATFSRLSEDTLFFAFYFQQGLVQQYFAAEELQRRGFVLHKQFNMWFKHTGELLKSSQTMDQGAYAYFDYELRSSADGAQMHGWRQRTTAPDFQFYHKDAHGGSAPKATSS